MIDQPFTIMVNQAEVAYLKVATTILTLIIKQSFGDLGVQNQSDNSFGYTILCVGIRLSLGGPKAIS